MKILHVLPSVSLKLGGPTQVALNLVRNLREIGIEAEIATTNDDNGGILTDETKSSESYKGVPIHYFPVSFLKLRQFIVSLSMLRWLWRNCRNYDFIDIHYFFTFSGTVASCIARLKGVPYSVRPMGQLTEWSINFKKIKKQIYWRLFDSHMLKHAAIAQCTSKEEVADLRRISKSAVPSAILALGAEETVVLEDASKVLKKKYNIPDNSSVILFMSRLHEKKRPDHLIKVFKRMANLHPVHLILAGTGERDYVNSLKKLAEDSGITSKVTFTGFVYGEDKSLLLQGSDIFVLPSYSENFGIVIAEALIAGLPVIVSDKIQISQDIADADAGIVIDSEESSLLNALEKLLKSGEIRKLLSKNGRLLAKNKYSWKKAALELKDVYSSLILQT